MRQLYENQDNKFLSLLIKKGLGMYQVIVQFYMVFCGFFSWSSPLNIFKKTID